MEGCEPFSATGNAHGVLVLHGFTGNPQSMRPLAEVIANAGFTVELPRLPGHGTSVEDMIDTTWADWTKEAEDAYQSLASRCRDVAVVGLSMGGALACHVAERYPVRAAVLINPLVSPPANELLEGLEALIEGGVETVEAIGSDIKKEGSKEASYDATPLKAARSLFEGVADVYARLGDITAPTLLFSSREDHVVDPLNGEVVLDKVAGTVERVILEESYHVATLDHDAELIESMSVSFLTRDFD